MSTQTAAAAAVIVTTSPELVKACRAMLDAETKLNSARVAMATTARQVADRKGYNRDQCRDMIKFAMREVHGIDGKDAQKTADFDNLHKSRVSTILTLAYPVDTHAQDVAQAIKDNASGKLPRVGENTLIRIARGNVTLADVRAGKVTSTNSNSGSGNGGGSTMTPEEKFANAIAGALSASNVGLKDGLAWDVAEKAIANAVKIRKDAQKGK